MQIVLVTGGFDPLHSGHIAYFKEAAAIGDYLVVGVNSDAWLERKKGRSFMPLNERVNIIQHLTMVNKVIHFDDDDNTAIGAILKVKEMYPDADITFANGGDRTSDNISGEDKKNSSSWILKEWSQPTTERSWGRYTVLDKGEGWQVKQLAFDPGKALSDQRHLQRSEHWHVVEGNIQMSLEFPNGDTEVKTYAAGHSIDIPINTWHKATNIGDIPAKVIEVWLGSKLSEYDIERRD